MHLLVASSHMEPWKLHQAIFKMPFPHAKYTKLMATMKQHKENWTKKPFKKAKLYEKNCTQYNWQNWANTLYKVAQWKLHRANLPTKVLHRKLHKAH